MIRKAEISPCGTWRYTLTREWDSSLPSVAFIGLNPSIADENIDDPTIRRCIGFAKSWGHGRLVMLNLFAYRSTDPKILYYKGDAKRPIDPSLYIGPRNDEILISESSRVNIVIAAWGHHGALYKRSSWAREHLKSLHYLALTLAGEPRHPLYLKKTLMPWPLCN